MQPEFEDAVIQSKDERLSLLGDWNLLITLVHEGSGAQSLEDAIVDSFEDERFIRVDLRKCNEAGRLFWTAISSVEAEINGFPDRTEKPVPFLHAWLPGMGNYSSVNDPRDVASFLERSRKEKAQVVKFREYMSHKDQTDGAGNQTPGNSE